MAKLTKKIETRYPVYLKKVLPGTSIVLSQVMVIGDQKSIYVNQTLDQIEKSPLNDLFYKHERGMVPSTKQEFDDAFIKVSYALLEEVSSFEKCKSKTSKQLLDVTS